MTKKKRKSGAEEDAELKEWGLKTIAELDAAFERGEIDRGTYFRMRSDLLHVAIRPRDCVRLTGLGA
jgi:hypothetical protein